MTPDPQQPKEYIIDGEYIEKLDEWLGEHDINELQRMQIRARLKMVPHTNEENHCDKCDHWDMCEGCPYTDERSRPLPAPAAPAEQQIQTLDEIWKGCADLRSNESGDAFCAMYGECCFPNCYMSGLGVRKAPKTLREIREREAALIAKAQQDGAKQERERVLDDVAQWVQKHTHICRPLGIHVVSKSPLTEFIQSLRQSPEQQEQQR
jgi:radical SAM protein with 4Fe4S-binding SPASM domain